jgi:hypothetical protein
MNPASDSLDAMPSPLHHPRDHRVTSLSPVIDDQFAHVQAVDTEFVDLDDAEAGAPDRQVTDDQAAKGERPDRDSSDRKGSEREAADTLGADRLGADRARRGASRWSFFHVFLHMALVRARRADVHSARIATGDAGFVLCAVSLANRAAVTVLSEKSAKGLKRARPMTLSY